MHLPGTIKLQFWEKYHTLFCILAPFGIIVALLSIKNVLLPPIFFLDFKSPCFSSIVTDIQLRKLKYKRKKR